MFTGATTGWGATSGNFAVTAGYNYTIRFDLDKGTCTGTNILAEVYNASTSLTVASQLFTATGTNQSISFTANATGNFRVRFITNSSSACRFFLDEIFITYSTETVNTVCGNAKDYRFGFNGQERDNEVYGQGNAYTAEFWEYDPRIGRRWNIDPMTGFYPEQSPYAAFNNNPIYYADPLGLEGESPENKEKGKNPGGSPEKDQKEFDGFKDICNNCGTAENPVQLPEFNFEDDRLPDMSPPPESGGFAEPKGRTLTNMDKHMAAFHQGFTSPGYFTRNTNVPWNGYSWTQKDHEVAKKVYIEVMITMIPIGRVGGLMWKGGRTLYNTYKVSRFVPGAIKTGDELYGGVRTVSKFLQMQGVPRAYRIKIIQSFEVGTMSLKVADDATFGLRFYGGAADETGRYLFPAFTNYSNRVGLALPYSWNSMAKISQFQVAPGSIYIYGRAAPQGSYYAGGSYQMFVNNLGNLIK